MHRNQLRSKKDWRKVEKEKEEKKRAEGVSEINQLEHTQRTPIRQNGHKRKETIWRVEEGKRRRKYAKKRLKKIKKNQEEME